MTVFPLTPPLDLRLTRETSRFGPPKWGHHNWTVEIVSPTRRRPGMRHHRSSVPHLRPKGRSWTTHERCPDSTASDRGQILSASREVVRQERGKGAGGSWTTGEVSARRRPPHNYSRASLYGRRTRQTQDRQPKYYASLATAPGLARVEFYDQITFGNLQRPGGITRERERGKRVSLSGSPGSRGATFLWHGDGGYRPFYARYQITVDRYREYRHVNVVNAFGTGYLRRRRTSEN
ncbi:hypothetical protein EVAR_37670_1 [Eumeta japonica]|uniref:Uncharacterized protein n=1 Tax=Eumeta variegata TaxID=151549 RepID=A0A4C1YW89_EUMVA|nr:hypothetical protein EVAR_37670_1 [Eumeta japonica]